MLYPGDDNPQSRRQGTGTASAAVPAPSVPPQAPPPALPERSYAVLDTETTGLSPARGDRIISLALVTVEGGRVTDRWSSLCNPERDTGPVHIHGITTEQAAAAPHFAELVPEMLRRLRGRVLVAHNAGFDLLFLASELERAGHDWQPETVVDTLRLARRFLPELDNHRLGTCARALRIPLRAHRADSDAEATAALLLHLLGVAAEEGHTDLSRLGDPGSRTLRLARRRAVRCDAAGEGLAAGHRAAHQTLERWPGSAEDWQRALTALTDHQCPEAARLWIRFSTWLTGTGPDSGGRGGRRGAGHGPGRDLAHQALTTALGLELAAPEPDREEIGGVISQIAHLDAAEAADAADAADAGGTAGASPGRLLALFPEPAGLIAALPPCDSCWSCDTLGSCATGSPAGALVAHYAAALRGPAAGPETADELAGHLPLLEATGDLAALGRAARFVGQVWEKHGREAEAAALWHRAVDLGARDVVLFNRLSLHYERRLGDHATALAVCRRALDGRRGRGARAAWDAITKRAARCRRRLSSASRQAYPGPSRPSPQGRPEAAGMRPGGEESPGA
ncbi:3'-5' exonuclease [Streptomyces sp. YIM 98790]|uniref:3'-5' exonuclease n=1 Tax=Streptomyces sp. YIM 98790 TaxID=2689077 RepID=UPI0028BDDE9C|nr:3'-5' exonuclease [Streptomyces sp. YIM 98790]